MEETKGEQEPQCLYDRVSKEALPLLGFIGHSDPPSCSMKENYTQAQTLEHPLGTSSDAETTEFIFWGD